MPAQPVQRLAAVSGEGRAVIVHLQRELDSLANVVVVVDDQHHVRCVAVCAWAHPPTSADCRPTIRNKRGTCAAPFNSNDAICKLVLRAPRGHSVGPDNRNAGVANTGKPTANVQDAGAGTYSVYAGKSSATGGVELDVFYPPGGPPFATIAVRRGSLVFVLGIPASKNAQAQLTKLAGIVLKRF